MFDSFSCFKVFRAQQTISFREKSVFFSTSFKPTDKLVKEANDIFEGKKGFYNLITSLKVLLILYGKCETELLDYQKLVEKQIVRDFDFGTGFYEQDSRLESPIVRIPNREGVSAA